MSIMSIRLIAMVVVVSGFALPLSAQHSGAHDGRDGAGPGSAPMFRGGSMPMMERSGDVGVVQYRIGQSSGSILINRPAPVAPDHRTGFGSRDGNRRRPLPGERPSQRTLSAGYSGFGLPYSVGWVGPGFVGYPDPAFYDNSALTMPAPTASYSNEPAAQPVQEESEAAPAQEAPPASTYRPVYQSPLPPASEPEPEDAVTLVFKDGRPNEQISNYMLTRTTLYVQEKRLREIAVADLDLDATAKVNRESGVDFRLPDSK